jgi:CheY-like chemotaxis protein/signal transduction histidine kinase
LQLSFRAKLTSIVVITTVAFAAVLLVYAVVGYRETLDLNDVESRMVPKLELGPKLESQFEHLRQSMQDAVAAQDPAALDDSIRQRNEFIAAVSSAGSALTQAEAAQLRHAITAYHDAAYPVSRRLMRGETGEALVDALAAMQAQQRATQGLIERSARLERKELTAGFAKVRNGIATGTRSAMAIGIASLLVVLALSGWVARGVLGSLQNLSRGVARFATGDFAEPIPVTTGDELGKLTLETNQMAESLRRSDWMREGLAGLSHDLRADLTPEGVAEAVLRFLARRIGAVAGAFFVDDGKGELVAIATHALDGDGEPGARRFRRGEGLVGQAAEESELTLLHDPPAEHFTVCSGLGESAPKLLLLVPLRRTTGTSALLELAFFSAPSPDALALLEAAREMIVISLEVAHARNTQRLLLVKSQQQGDLLAAQEEELRASNRELTDQQDELRRANDELELQRQALSAQNVALEEAREGLLQKAADLTRVSGYKSQFLANMSHELRTPLNSMLLLSHLLAENEGKNLSEKQVEYAKTINSAGKDLLALINQVLDLAKIEAGKQDVDATEVPLAELTERAERLFAAAAQSKGVAFKVELDPALPATIVTDRQRVERILVNLVGNALKFTERGEVKLRVYRPTAGSVLGSSKLEPAASVAFAVSDTGIGIPPSAQERIFSPFEQAEARADRRYGGTGLGLAIARESATLLGGDLVLESREGRGSTFTCFLPERIHGQAPGARVDKRTGALDDGHHLSIAPERPYLLIVEDDRVFAEAVVEMVQARGFEAVVATSGEEALLIARAHKPRGVILDVKLPDIDGWTVMERLRHDPATRSVPVHFISGVEAPERAFSLGAVGYLTKPATPQELVGAIRLLLRPPEADQARVLVVEDDAEQGGTLVELLRRAGLDADHVGSGHAALEALGKQRFSCVILDLGLPDMDGLGLLETLRTRDGLPMPPVVVHTGRTLTREEIRRVEAYAQAVVLKDGNSGERLLDEVRLFVQHVHADGPRPPALAPPNSLLPDVTLSGTRILVADDDMRTVYALSALLRGKGADVLIAENGREALEVLGENPRVSAVLMDVMMPEMDGYEALRRMRQDGRFAQLPAIALTAKAMKGERERCLEAGASDYLAKPVDPARLLTLLGSLLKAKGHAQPDRS